MTKMQNALVEDGYRVINIGYPSNKKSLDELSNIVAADISEHVAPGDKVNFVTHSLGGIVVRSMLKKSPPWDTQKVVMLAPPNQGIEIIERLFKLKLAWLLGPVSNDLVREAMQKSPPTLPKNVELGVIMGTDSGWWTFNQILADQNDGLVTVKEGKMQGMKDFKTIHNNHTFIMLDNDVIIAIRHFLKTGSFR